MAKSQKAKVADADKIRSDIEDLKRDLKGARNTAMVAQRNIERLTGAISYCEGLIEELEADGKEARKTTDPATSGNAAGD